MTMMTRVDPFANMMSLREAVNQLLEDSFVSPFRLMQPTTIMPVDVFETDEAFVVKAFMPGLTPDQLNISIERNVLTIQGEPQQALPQGMQPIRLETQLGAFTRQITLPMPVDADHVQATLEQGVLTLTLPKPSEAKPRKIQISATA